MRKRILRSIIAVLCVLAVCLCLPAEIGVGTGLAVKAEASEEPYMAVEGADSSGALTIGAAKAIEMVVGQSLSLRVTNIAEGTSVKWSSSNKSVATVTKRGRISAKQKGKTTITAKFSGMTLTCTIRVKRNCLKLKTTSPRKTGFYTYTQSGKLKASVKMYPTFMEFTGPSTLIVQFRVEGLGNVGWKDVRRFRNVYFKTKTGTLLVDKEVYYNSENFAITPTGKKSLTLTFKGGEIKNFTDLTGAKGVKYSLDFYASSVEPK